MSDSRDVIQARLLANIDDSYNKSEGEFMYDAEMPVAIELESTYSDIDAILDKSMLDTAKGKNLDRIGALFGVPRKTSTQATGTVTITGTSGSAINSGDSVATDSLQFQFTENTTIPSNGTIGVTAQCTSYGSIGNVPVGAIKYFPKTLAGLTSVTNSQAFDTGTDEEDDDTYRARILEKIQEPSTSGNVSDYKQWALSINGVGNAKILPLWNGNGTVKVVIIDSSMKPASSTLISNVQTYIESIRPIGATVTYESASELDINISASITIDSASTTTTQAQTDIETAITSYLASIAFNQDYVSYAKVGSLILAVTGVTDYSNLTLNNATTNVTIGNEQVAVLGGVTIA
jgi:uncharacterized phage protein gp47/JayE